MKWVSGSWALRTPFQHTYEGLKRDPAGDGAGFEVAFQHTYEGLKHEDGGVVDGVVAGFPAYL